MQTRRATTPTGTERTTASAVSRLSVWRSVDEIESEAWEAVRQPGDIFMDVRFLQAVERSMAPQTQFWYLLFRDEQGQPAAIACLSTYIIDGTMLAPEGAAKGAAQLLGKVIPWAVHYKVLFCGIPLSSGQSHLRFAPGADEPAIIALLCQTMDDVAKKERARVIVWKEFRDDERPAADAAEHYGYRRADSPPMNLAIRDHESFDAFLDALNSARRKKIRRSLRRLDGTNVEVINTSDAAKVHRLLTDDVHALYVAMFEKSETKVEFMPLEFFRELPVHLPDNCQFQFLVEGETVLAFGASVFSDDSYHALLAGVDYSRNAEFDLYFNLVYHNFAAALSSGAQEIHVGANADQFKQSRLGCRPRARSIYIKGARPPIRMLLRLLFNRLFPPIDAEPANQ